MNWLELLEIKLPVLAASLMGAIAALTFEEKVSFVRACGMIVCGAAASSYSNTVVMHFFGLPQHYTNAVAFLVGLVAMNLSRAILQAASKIDADTIMSLFPKLVRKNGSNKPNSDSDR